MHAYVALAPGSRVDSDKLIAYCREPMAAYKYPLGIDVVQMLPKNAAGKILRRELRDQVATRGADRG